ncbi:hypothetical protein BV898_01331 [Hypsibius exemplaris]|uniref:Uncharacterized protein n=1 Tax=Hypsibius exemplaris TaxID=2072580 RepID=A0A1W0XB56_HYPEX|nr:hypothetical protein BV898_01331 [Hypsibius exemplaris]
MAPPSFVSMSICRVDLITSVITGYYAKDLSCPARGGYAGPPGFFGEKGDRLGPGPIGSQGAPETREWMVVQVYRDDRARMDQSQEAQLGVQV